MRIPFLAFSGTFKFFDRLAWRHYQYVFCNSEEVRRRILAAGLAPPEKVEVLSPGLDVETMKPTWEYRKYFVVVGRVKWWKNLELAVDSFIEFKRRHPEHAEFELHITGLVEPGSETYFRKLQRMAAGRGDIVFLRDPTETELLAAYASSYGLVFPSLNEDWGMTPLEAMGFGKPVIAVRQGGPTESIVDGKTGILVPPEPGAFAAAMAKLADDSALVRKMGEAGTAHVQKYDWNNFVRRMDDYLDACVKE